MDKMWFTDENRLIYKSRIHLCLERCPQDAIQSGTEWYNRAYAISEDMASRYDVPGIVVRRILSALSPRNYWERNVIGAETLITKGPKVWCGSTYASSEKAYKMLMDHSLHLFTTNAPKTYHFFLNMDRPEEDTGVTIDRHTVYVLGIPFNPNKKGPMGRLPKGQYYWIANIYREVAKEHRMLPHQVQAIVWECQRDNNVPDWEANGYLPIGVNVEN